MNIKKIKKLAYYAPVFALVGTISLFSPDNTIIAHAEEEEVLYEETEGGELQEEIDESVVPENTITPIVPEVTPAPIEDATAEDNQNQIINADPNFYFDNSDYFPATDTSENPGTTIPEDTEDEVDVKGLEPTPEPEPEPTPTPTPEPTPVPTPTPEIPDKPTPPDIPKMGEDFGGNYIKVAETTFLGGLVLLALKSLIKHIAKRIRIANNRAQAEEDGFIKVKSAKRKFRFKKKDNKEEEERKLLSKIFNKKEKKLTK